MTLYYEHQVKAAAARMVVDRERAKAKKAKQKEAKRIRDEAKRRKQLTAALEKKDMDVGTMDLDEGICGAFITGRSKRKVASVVAMALAEVARAGKEPPAKKRKK
jgi:hypothetical protein